MQCTIFPTSETTVTAYFGNVISAEVNRRVIQIADFLSRTGFEGFREVVPGYSSLTVFFDPVVVRRRFTDFPNASSAVKALVERAVADLPGAEMPAARKIEIPVCYGGEFGPDLEFVANAAKLSAREVIAIHTSSTYRVYMIGFLPGFAYMGEVAPAIAVPRKDTPALNVTKGSVGIAGKQTGVYPLDSPGGWQIIGKTPVELFTPAAAQISLLEAGDTVKFVEISADEFRRHKK